MLPSSRLSPRADITSGKSILSPGHVSLAWPFLFPLSATLVQAVASILSESPQLCTSICGSRACQPTPALPQDSWLQVVMLFDVNVASARHRTCFMKLVGRAFFRGGIEQGATTMTAEFQVQKAGL